MVIAGNVVHSDMSLGCVHETPGATEFFVVRFRAEEDTVLGHFKAHLFNLVSLAVVKEANEEERGIGVSVVKVHSDTRQVHDDYGRLVLDQRA
ncbi:hypothetical protein BV22DRAFT_849319 [Leucogyrophana mollusca]|uniref:Uncharacterized protein n=1 Tax=Leucogyrophana mollusca TaxID=85980 RepID=A0ACB8B296_9AGAM|nr:hypothetical protein BV22DRAFT_849319 [Leucogyrophana mollusca]